MKELTKMRKLVCSTQSNASIRVESLIYDNSDCPIELAHIANMVAVRRNLDQPRLFTMLSLTAAPYIEVQVLATYVLTYMGVSLAIDPAASKDAADYPMLDTKLNAKTTETFVEMIEKTIYAEDMKKFLMKVESLPDPIWPHRYADPVIRAILQQLPELSNDGHPVFEPHDCVAILALSLSASILENTSCVCEVTDGDEVSLFDEPSEPSPREEFYSRQEAEKLDYDDLPVAPTPEETAYRHGEAEGSALEAPPADDGAPDFSEEEQLEYEHP